MTAVNIYLNFEGSCREAMTFYAQCMAANPNFTEFPDDPARILHAELKSGPLVLMAADVAPGALFQAGNNFSVSVACESLSEMEKLFAALGKGGRVTLPVHVAFWGGHMGALTDRFGIGWMLSFR